MKDKAALSFRLTIGKSVKGKLAFTKKEESTLEAALNGARGALKAGAKEVIIAQ